MSYYNYLIFQMSYLKGWVYNNCSYFLRNLIHQDWLLKNLHRQRQFYREFFSYFSHSQVLFCLKDLKTTVQNVCSGNPLLILKFDQLKLNQHGLK